MASLRQIRRRMRSIENIHDITKAMEMIAAFRYKRAEGRYTKSRPYFLDIERLVSNLSNAGIELGHPLFEKRRIQKKALLVMTADKGLCGAYNANLLRTAAGWLRDNQRFETYVVTVGKIGADYFAKKRLARVLSSYPEKSRADLAMARKISGELKDGFLQGKLDSVEVLYTSYRAGGSGRIRLAPYLGLVRLLEGGEGEKIAVDYIYEPSFEEIFSALLARFLEGEMYGILLESLTSEYLARMIAMKQATENGEEVLDNLRLLRNKTRQATITRELTEIVSGANALV